jgi:hypothetical protein
MLQFFKDKENNSYLKPASTQVLLDSENKNIFITAHCLHVIYVDNRPALRPNQPPIQWVLALILG